MSSSIQNELSMGIIEPPADTRTRRIVESAARFISKRGLDFERKILDSNPKDAKFNFLRSSADPCHAYYKRKLAEYLTQNQDDPDETAIKIVLAPENLTTRAIVDIIAGLVIKFGYEFKLMVIDSNKDDARFNFLSSSADPYHELYQKKLDYYRANPQDSYYKQKLIDYLVQSDRKGSTTDVSYPMDIKIFHASPDVTSTTIVDRVACLETKYGSDFGLMVMASNLNDARFFFMRTADRYYMNRLGHYSSLNHDKVPDHSSLNHDKVPDHSSLNHDKVPDPCPQSQSRVRPPPPPPELLMMHLPPPEPLTFVPDERLLVPEDQFLAQHPGLSIIRVICVPDSGRVIKIPVKSLSENLASLKEEIARMVQVPPIKQVLSSTAGDLKDSKKSLAYYNVRPGAILIMKVK